VIAGQPDRNSGVIEILPTGQSESVLTLWSSETIANLEKRSPNRWLPAIRAMIKLIYDHSLEIEVGT
jgi:hypothetical protein